MIAALYVAPGGCYWDLPGVEPWGCRETPRDPGIIELPPLRGNQQHDWDLTLSGAYTNDIGSHCCKCDQHVEGSIPSDDGCPGHPERDARLYEGPWPVVAHPPCGRWCRLAGLVEARYPDRPDLRRGEDGGCFRTALESVRRWGGVLEHPAHSDAWAAHDLNAPPSRGGWVNADFQGGWTCYVEQHRYGHPAKKATWLYAVAPTLPELKWGLLADGDSKAWISWCGNHTTEPRMAQKRWALVSDGGLSTSRRAAMVSRLYREEPRDGVPADRRPRLTTKAASATPPAFRDALLDIARSCLPRAAAGGER